MNEYYFLLGTKNKQKCVKVEKCEDLKCETRCIMPGI